MPSLKVYHMRVILWRAFFLIAFFVFSPTILSAQTILNIPISGTFTNQLVPDVLEKIGEQYQVSIYYDPDNIPMYPIDVSFDQTELYLALRSILSGNNLTFTKYQDDIIIIVPRDELNAKNAKRIVAAWENGVFRSPTTLPPQDQYLTIGEAGANKSGPFTLSGKIIDGETKETVIGASIFKPATATGTATDAEGNYTLKLPAGDHDLSIQYFGYQTIEMHLSIYDNGLMNLELEVQPFRLQEVIVKSEKENNKVASTSSGIETLTAKSIRELPSFMGEADVIKSLEMLPGVSTIGEGATGFNVRGGSIDQNLIMQDGAMLFNSSHALGFFSIFNNDAVKKVSLYKGSIPAQYGGRLSSVLEVEMRDGNFNKIKGNGGLGLASTRFTLEGPLVKNKTSFLAGGRISYSDWILRQAIPPDIKASSASFSDWMVRISHRLSSKSKVFGSAFQSRDFFRFSDQFGYAWQTQLYQVNLQHFFSDNTSGNLSLIHGSYRSELFDPEGTDAFDYQNGIQYFQLKPSLLLTKSKKHEINLGADIIYYNSTPEQIAPRGTTSAIQSSTVNKEQALESSIYINDDLHLSEKFSISLGLRYTHYLQLGANEQYLYTPDAPLDVDNIIDTLSFGANQVVSDFGGLEPRVSAKLQLGKNNSLKVSYNRMRQYIHLVSNSAASTPVDLWQLSTPYFTPQSSHNYSIGYFQNFKDNLWQTSLEFFYKDMSNILTYKDFPQLLLNPQLETDLVQAKGRAYGAEFSISKSGGKWNGRFSYSLSQSLIRTESPFLEERINEGKWFPADFDQPHNISLAAQWRPNPVISMQFNFSYRSGRPISVPASSYQVGDFIVSHFSPRNQFRIPAYHRFDWAFTVDRSESKRKGFRSSLTLSLYNVYGRQNPFSLFFRRNEKGVQQAYKLSVLGSAFPGVSYNFLF